MLQVFDPVVRHLDLLFLYLRLFLQLVSPLDQAAVRRHVLSQLLGLLLQLIGPLHQIVVGLDLLLQLLQPVGDQLSITRKTAYPFRSLIFPAA